MASDKIPGIKRLLFGIFLIALSAITAKSEYDELRSSDWAKGLFEREMWTAAVVFGVLGIAILSFGIWAARKNRRD
jgi:hypothetical protein